MGVGSTDPPGSVYGVPLRIGPGGAAVCPNPNPNRHRHLYAVRVLVAQRLLLENPNVCSSQIHHFLFVTSRTIELTHLFVHAVIQ